MHDFPPISREAEAQAAATLFFKDSEFEGKTCRLPIANYLAFLSLRGEEAVREIEKLREAMSEPSTAHLERDVSLLLRARNWRFHNIACVAIACTGASATLLDELWQCIQLGSWTSPQLAATAVFVDPSFVNKAMRLIEDRTTYYKSIVSLAALLTSQIEGAPSISPAAQANIGEAIGIDRDRSGDIAVGWYKNLLEAFSAA
jgi:hypothetical protein